MELDVIIKNLIIIAIILTLAFFSQNPSLVPTEKALYSQIQQQGAIYGSKVSAWLYAGIYPKASGEVSKLQDTAAQKITEQKNNIMQNIWGIIKNYFAEKFSKTFGTPVE
jgi:hypothetical protein